MLAQLLSPAKRCPCGRSRLPRFMCCGRLVSQGSTPFGITVIPNFIERYKCGELLDSLSRASETQLGVVDIEKSSADKIAVKTGKGRISSMLDTTAIEAELDALVARLCRGTVAAQYGQAVDWFEKPMVLQYTKGGRYKRHADSEQYMDPTEGWRRVLDRDVSALIYLDDDFQGGELEFYFFNFRYRPTAGDAVIFPSDHRYAHEARIVEQGIRHAIVSWIALKGTRRVMDKPPENVRRQ